MSRDVAITARLATAADLGVVETLYRELEAEQTGLKDMWPLADGLPEPVDVALAKLLADDDVVAVVGEVEDYPFGFAVAMIEELLPQAEGLRVGAIRLIFTEPDARGVGVGEAMIGLLLTELAARSVVRFDAHVLPGHRAAKNFFEAAGFAARSIVMHHEA